MNTGVVAKWNVKRCIEKKAPASLLFYGRFCTSVFFKSRLFASQRSFTMTTKVSTNRIAQSVVAMAMID